MSGLLQKIYQRQINALKLTNPEPLPPDPDDPKWQAAMRQALVAKQRAEHIIHTLQEQKLARQS